MNKKRRTVHCTPAKSVSFAEDDTVDTANTDFDGGALSFNMPLSHMHRVLDGMAGGLLTLEQLAIIARSGIANDPVLWMPSNLLLLRRIILQRPDLCSGPDEKTAILLQRAKTAGGYNEQAVAELTAWSTCATGTNSPAWWLLGRLHDLEERFGESLKWYHKAAVDCDVGAQFSLALCYYNGEGVDRDLTLAVHWFRKAADQGHAGAESNLGCAYDLGEGMTFTGSYVGATNKDKYLFSNSTASVNKGTVIVMLTKAI